jgi:predicted  nucleic acid-binding Zn-ribbon protein
MTHSDLTELQIEISELEKENQELKDRVKDLEVNLTYLSNQLATEKPKTIKWGNIEIGLATDNSVH